MKVKVCGMRHPENLKQLVELYPDYIGFIFYPRSKRFVGDIDEEVLLRIPNGIRKTGVFVNAELPEVIDKVDRYQLNAVQLHGSEDADFCKKMKDKGIEVIKAFGIDPAFDFSSLTAFEGSLDYFLFDTKTVQHGGSGQVFDWTLLKKYSLQIPYFLSGGLNLDNLGKVVELNDERFYAIDINSCFETEPGIKDISKVEEAIRVVRPGSKSVL